MIPSRALAVVVFATTVVVTVLPAQPVRFVSDPLLRNFRIALRFGSGQVLIVGGEIQGPYDTNGILDTGSVEKLPRSTRYASLQPGEEIYLVQPHDLTHFEFQPATNWHGGDRWRVYSGAGPAATVVIQQLAVILYCGGIGGYAAAIADFVSPNAVNLIDGLRAREYLAAPGQGLAAVSSTPLIPADIWHERESTSAIAKLLLAQARAIVNDENWTITPNTDKTFADHIRRMNRLLRAAPRTDPEIRYFRWTPPGSRSLLFAEVLWVDEDGMPLFACDAVVEEGKDLTVLSFDATQATLMRAGEFADHRWRLEETNTFLNAWKIGNRYFVLGHTSGYEASGVQLLELVRRKGLVPVDLRFGAGC